MLFKCQSAVLLGLNNVACTSKECEWNKSRKQADPLPLSQIQFKRPKKEEQISSILADKEYTTKGFSNPDPAKKDSLELKEKFKKLNAIASEAVVFTSISRSYLHGDLEESTDEETDTASETEENSLPEPLPFLNQLESMKVMINLFIPALQNSKIMKNYPMKPNGKT